MRQIYLDYNATTPVDSSIVEVMLPFLEEHYGNPSSIHALGRAAHAAIEDARGYVADLLGAAVALLLIVGAPAGAKDAVEIDWDDLLPAALLEADAAAFQVVLHQAEVFAGRVLDHRDDVHRGPAPGHGECVGAALRHRPALPLRRLRLSTP